MLAEIPQQCSDLHASIVELWASRLTERVVVSLQEEIMSQGDSLYDLVDPRDHGTVQTELLSGPPSITMHMQFPDERVFICRMNLSRAAKRQLQYQKVCQCYVFFCYCIA